MNKKTPFARVAAKGRGRVLFQKRPAKEIPRARGKGGGPDPPKLSGNVTFTIKRAVQLFNAGRQQSF